MWQEGNKLFDLSTIGKEAQDQKKRGNQGGSNFQLDLSPSKKTNMLHTKPEELNSLWNNPGRPA